MKDAKMILMLALCIVISMLGVYFQFFGGPGKSTGEDVTSQQDNENWRERNIESQEIPLEKEQKEAPAGETELTPERFGLEDGWSVYFTEMTAIQEDNTFLPYQAYADLVPVTMEFLKAQAELELPGTDLELRLNENMVRREEHQIGFHCYFAELETNLEIEYIYDDIQMKYTEIHFVEKETWRFEWKK